ncbi:hypothetical protein BV22DRAFT_1198248 [Leucogyrophana mollusca]|uniref:Uncharacterized protein n=1 Tax=Leucogyrophana mollusca TaxID=85980 RepID=A0ACB8B6T4_9AGAM|nr:hypothetical protein BV22DRAFT_1198248 [Leucogyrophana mollusca]
MTGSPSAATLNSLVFSGCEAWELDQNELVGHSGHGKVSPGQSVAGPSTWVKQEESSEQKPISDAYVEVFEEMIATVIKYDEHLLSPEEIDQFAAYNNLSGNAKFLMVKLLLRKPDTWYRLESLNYGTQMGGIEGLVNAIEELCRSTPDPLGALMQEELQIKEEEQEVIDLTLDDEDELPQEPVNPPPEPQEPQAAPPPFDVLPKGEEETVPEAIILAEDETIMDLRSLLECLKVDELKVIAKQWKLKSILKKSDIISALLSSTSTQTTLSFPVPTSKDKCTTGKPLHQTKLPFSNKKLRTSQERLREVVIKSLRKCIRVDSNFFTVVRRANLIFFRSTQYTPDLLLPALLCRFNKRFYAAYECARTNDIWRTREDLLAYEAALELEGRVDAILGGDTTVKGDRSIISETPARATSHQFRTPVTPAKVPHAPAFSSPLVTPTVKGKGKANMPGIDEDAEIDLKVNVEVDVKPESPRVRGARMVSEILDTVYPQWEVLVKTKGEEDGRRFGLERFDCGHVLTRVVCKGAYALGILGDYNREVNVLEALLAQKRWRRGRRGRWHERRLVVLMTHFANDEATTIRAMNGVIEALEDTDTHIVYRPKLERRLTRLEKRLGLSPGDRHTSEGKLRDAEKVTFEGVRIRHRAASLALDRTGRNTKNAVIMTTPKKNPDIRQHLPLSSAAPRIKNEKPLITPVEAKGKQPAYEQKGKSIWSGRDGVEVNVETFALQQYENQGFKGIHCETQVLHMMFGLLFWDIIFSPIPGAFETPYQSAPLDIAEDSFYHSRKDAIEQRLSDIENGGAVEIVKRIDGEHREKGTWCVGVKWETFTSEDLVDIVNCLGGQALSVICRVFCEDYAGRCSGGPDLFLWNAEKGICKFVEVKGPGDSLQENQKVWIDLLLRAPVAVELCHVEEKDAAPRKGKRKRGNAKKGKLGAKNMPESDEESEMPIIESEDEPDELAPSSQTLGNDELHPPRRSTRSRSRTLLSHETHAPSVDYNAPVKSSVSPDVEMDLTPSQEAVKKRRLVNRAEVLIVSPKKKQKLSHPSLGV